MKDKGREREKEPCQHGQVYAIASLSSKDKLHTRPGGRMRAGCIMHSLQPSPLGCPLLLLRSLQQLVHINREQITLAVIATKQQVDIHLRCVHPIAASIPFPCSPYCTALSDLLFSLCCRLPGSLVVPCLSRCWVAASNSQSQP